MRTPTLEQRNAANLTVRVLVFRNRIGLALNFCSSAGNSLYSSSAPAPYLPQKMRILSLPVRARGFAAFLAAASVGFAQSYVGSAYEPFNYTSGATIDATLAGGTGWNATGDAGLANTTTWATGPATGGTGRTVSTTGLSYTNPSYPTSSGLGASISGVPGSSNVGRLIGQTVSAGTFYFSFLTQKTVNQVRTVNFSLFNGTNERLAIGQIANNVNLKNPDGSVDSTSTANSGAFVALISNPQGGVGTAGVYSSSAPIAFDTATTHLVVGKIEFDFVGGAADRLSLYVDPSSITDEGSLTPYLQVASNDFGALNGFRVFAGATASGFTASAQ